VRTGFKPKLISKLVRRSIAMISPICTYKLYYTCMIGGFYVAVKDASKLIELLEEALNDETNEKQRENDVGK
jgi:hypothetical protein